MTFDEFRTQVEAAGLTARACTPHHWHIIGGAVLVNWWPGKNKMYAAAVGMGRARIGTVEEATELAMGYGIKAELQLMDYCPPLRSEEYDRTTRIVAWVALLCGGVSLLISVFRSIPA